MHQKKSEVQIGKESSGVSSDFNPTPPLLFPTSIHQKHPQNSHNFLLAPHLVFSSSDSATISITNPQILIQQPQQDDPFSLSPSPKTTPHKRPLMSQNTSPTSNSLPNSFRNHPFSSLKTHFQHNRISGKLGKKAAAFHLLLNRLRHLRRLRVHLRLILLLSLPFFYFLVSHPSSSFLLDFISAFAFSAALLFSLNLALPRLPSIRLFIARSFPIKLSSSHVSRPVLPVLWSIGSRPKLEKGVNSGCWVQAYSNGDVYEGEFHKGKCSGSGVYHYYMSGRYEGDWVDGKYDGYGVETWARGSRYRGQYRQGLRHGFGVYRFYTGDVYAGEWANGQSHGCGVHTCDDGSRYVGEFKWGVKHGLGHYHFSGNASVLTIVLKLIDKFDFYGQVAFPKHHKQNDVPDIYRLAAKTKGVFINPALVEPFGLTLIEAAAHGLPMVATKNGGPVDIHRALNNGLLIDPHDQQAIADALLKLVSEKNLWQDCQKNGWKNIHLFSWPEHCRTYLTRVAACRMRHPMWKTDTPTDDWAAEGSLNDSLKDVQDMSLRLSIDGEKSSLNESIDYSTAAGGDPEVQDQVKRVLSKMKKPEPGAQDSEGETKVVDNVPSKYPLLRRRRRLIVIALDCYDSEGAPQKKMVKIVQEIFKAIKLDPQIARMSGFAISTAMPISELTEFLKSGNIKVNEFDALICISGGEVYYPGTYTKEDGTLFPDPDYLTHIDYRWGSDGIKKTIWKLMNAPDGGEEVRSAEPSNSMEEDVRSSNSHCLSYLITDVNKAKKVDDMRQKLRIRGLRCHVMYCRNSTRMQVIPLLASRAQALRYLFVRWRLNVANMYVILGETGDTDIEELISGTHKTLIMKGVVEKCSEELLRSTGSYQREDIVPAESPLVTYTSGEAKSEEIANALRKVSRSSGM